MANSSLNNNNNSSNPLLLFLDLIPNIWDTDNRKRKLMGVLSPEQRDKLLPVELWGLSDRIEVPWGSVDWLEELTDADDLRSYGFDVPDDGRLSREFVEACDKIAERSADQLLDDVVPVLEAQEQQRWATGTSFVLPAVRHDVLHVTLEGNNYDDETEAEQRSLLGRYFGLITDRAKDLCYGRYLACEEDEEDGGVSSEAEADKEEEEEEVGAGSRMPDHEDEEGGKEKKKKKQRVC